MRLPLASRDDHKVEKVKWTSVNFAQEMASNISKAKKKKKSKTDKAEY